MVDDRGYKWKESAARIREARMRVGLTQREVSELLGVSTHTVWCWEAGKTKPTNEHLVELASRCEVSTDWLLGREVVEEELLEETEVSFPGGRGPASRARMSRRSGTSSRSCGSSDAERHRRG